MKNVVTLLLMAFVFWGIGALSQEKSGSQEQAQFSVEDDTVKSPISIPEEAWSVLRKDTSVLDVLADQNLSAEQLPKSWFTASAVHLSGSNERDLVVMGKGPLQGANVTTFWVFAQRPEGLRLVLNAPAHDLVIKPMRWNGYKTIEIASATAVRLSKVTFRFDGNQYRADTRPVSKPE